MCGREASAKEVPLVHQQKFAASIGILRWKAECGVSNRGHDVMGSEILRKNIRDENSSGAQVNSGD
jgi:hypothetical protein